jgi:hypothetical protein
LSTKNPFPDRKTPGNTRSPLPYSIISGVKKAKHKMPALFHYLLQSITMNREYARIIQDYHGSEVVQTVPSPSGRGLTNCPLSLWERARVRAIDRKLTNPHPDPSPKRRGDNYANEQEQAPTNSSSRH